MKLNRLLRTSLLTSAQSTGSFDPEKNLPLFEEDLTIGEAEQARAFLQWIHDHHYVYGRETIDMMWTSFQLTKENRKKDS